MAVKIRLARLSDMPAVYKLVQDLAIYEKEAAEVTATIADYEQAFNEDIFEVLLAEMDEKIVGMALYYMTYSTWKGKMLYLEDFVVKESYRHHGIGQLLFDAYISTAKEKDCKIVKWQVLDWNEPALKFYNKNNAIIEKGWWNGKIFLNTQK